MTSPRPAWFDLAAGDPVGTRTAQEVPARAEVVVVGLGASGLAACARLAARGADVVGLDAVGVAAGAAGANGGFLLAGLAMFHHDAVARLGRERSAAAYRWTLELLDRAWDEEPSARRTGSLRLADDDELADVEAHAAALRSDGFAVEAYEGVEGRGLLVPDDGVVHPVARCRRLARDAIAAGALLATAPDTERSRSRPEYRRWGYDYVQQLPSGEVLLGGGRDAGGDAEWGAEPVPTRAVQDHLDRELARLGVRARVTHRWAAPAAFTSDGLSVAATVRDGVQVVGAHNGHGNLIGPALAERAADAALDGVDLRLPV